MSNSERDLLERLEASHALQRDEPSLFPIEKSDLRTLLRLVREVERLREALAHARYRNHPHSCNCAGCEEIDTLLQRKPPHDPPHPLHPPTSGA